MTVIFHLIVFADPSNTQFLTLPNVVRSKRRRFRFFWESLHIFIKGILGSKGRCHLRYPTIDPFVVVTVVRRLKWSCLQIFMRATSLKVPLMLASIKREKTTKGGGALQWRWVTLIHFFSPFLINSCLPWDLILMRWSIAWRSTLPSLSLSWSNQTAPKSFKSSGSFSWTNSVPDARPHF